MPLLQMIALSLLLLTPTCYTIALIQLDTQTAPHYRTVRAIGSGLILKTIIIAILSLLGFLVNPDAAYAAPLLLMFLVGLASIRIIHLSSEH